MTDCTCTTQDRDKDWPFYLDQQLKWHLKLFRDKQENIKKENWKWDPLVNIQFRWMKEALHYLAIIKINAPGFDCDIDGSGGGSSATDQEIPTRPATLL